MCIICSNRLDTCMSAEYELNDCIYDIIFLRKKASTFLFNFLQLFTFSKLITFRLNIYGQSRPCRMKKTLPTYDVLIL